MAEYRKLRNKELKDILTARGLATRGLNKAGMIDALIEDDRLADEIDSHDDEHHSLHLVHQSQNKKKKQKK